MTNAWALSALWVGLALVATLFAIWFRVSTALSEIAVGTVAQRVTGLAALACPPWFFFPRHLLLRAHAHSMQVVQTVQRMPAAEEA
jgi:hypothetical protein